MSDTENITPEQPEEQAAPAVPDWNPKREWWLHGLNFVVTVKHCLFAYDIESGVNRWSVYAYIYPKHPHFKVFYGEDMRQDACRDLPLHWGPSYHKMHLDKDGSVTAHQVGSDYTHLYDAKFRSSDPADQFPNGTVFKDALKLFQWLDERKAVTNG